MSYILIALAAYLLGSFCASIPLSRRFYGADVRTMGSGNAGATNMARVFGLKAGLLTLALDMAKAIIAMETGSCFVGESGMALAGAFCIAGHCFPVYFTFRGGKGVSVGAALALMSGLRVFLPTIAVFLLVAFLGKKVSLGSICASIALALSSFIFRLDTPLLLLNTFSALLVIFMHRSNIVRLINGTEADFRPKT